jgi:two-component system, response regulator / RNA-binding antiterminator
VRVLLLYETQHNVDEMAEALSRDGAVVRSVRADALTMAEHIEAWPPDVVLIAADDPSRDMVEQICVATANRAHPFVMFTEADDPSAMRSLVQAGVAAYVVAGYVPSRMNSVIQVALERFAYERKQFDALRVAAQRENDARDVARAKAYLQRDGLSEADAYAKLRAAAMRERCTIADIARRVLGANVA